jgi:hypothetical protein
MILLIVSLCIVLLYFKIDNWVRNQAARFCHVQHNWRLWALSVQRLVSHVGYALGASASKRHHREQYGKLHDSDYPTAFVR